MNEICEKILLKKGFIFLISFLFCVVWVFFTAFVYMSDSINESYNAGCYYYPDELPVWEGNNQSQNPLETKNNSVFLNFSTLPKKT